jgi:hypothetical protein
MMTRRNAGSMARGHCLLQFDKRLGGRRGSHLGAARATTPITGSFGRFLGSF